MDWIKYDKITGRVISHGSGVAYMEEMIPRLPSEGSGTHYVTWTQTDASGRPLDPAIVPRTELEVSVTHGVAASETPAIVTIFSETPVVVRVDDQDVVLDEIETVDGRPAAVLELHSPIPKMWRIIVDEVARFSREILAQVR